VNALDRFTPMTECVEAVAAQLETELVFALGAEAAVALAASGTDRTLVLFANANFGLYVERYHGIPRERQWARQVPKQERCED